MTERPKDDDLLETALAAGRVAADRPVPDDLLARVEADALAHLPSRPRPAIGPGRWRIVLAALGGWPGIGGIATAGLMGLWLGFAAPGLWLGTIGQVADHADLLLPDDYIVASEG